MVLPQASNLMTRVRFLSLAPIYITERFLNNLIAGTDRYLGGAHNPAVVGSTPASATIGAVAHLGERIPCTDEVAGSIPVSSTSGCDGSTPSLPTKKIEKSLHKPLTFTPKP